MRKPNLMIAIGLPGSPHGDEDEDQLDREQDGNGGDDIATEAILSIVNQLKDRKASAVRDIRAFTTALEAMCEDFMQKDRRGFEDAASDARDALHNLISK